MLAKTIRILFSVPFLAAAVLALFVWLTVTVVQRSRRESAAAVPAEAVNRKPAVPGAIKEIGKTVTELTLPPERPDRDDAPREIPAELRKNLLALPAPMTFYTPATPAPAPKAPAVSSRYLPYGTLIPCKLVNTLDSTADGSPVIAIVLEDMRNIDQDGVSQLVIPAGTLAILDSTAPGHERDRIAADGRWMFVWRTRDENNGLELQVDGRALSRDYDPLTQTWGHPDGRSGLRGELIQDLNNERIQAAARTALESGISALKQYDVSSNALTGQVIRNPLPTLGNAALASAEAYVGQYSDQIRKQITDSGVYVQVTAGTEFYIFPRQAIDAQLARRGTAATVAAAREPTLSK